MAQAFKYKKGDKEALVKFIFNVKCKSSSTTEDYELVSASLDDVEPLPLPGDVDGDGEITISDVTALIDFYIGIGTPDLSVCDLDGDGVLTVEDIARLIELYLESAEPEE